jgi:predicted transcriptional regulator
MKVHIGQEIEKIYKERGIKLSVFAKQIGTVPRNVYRIFEKEDINTDLLITIGSILNFNFFKCFVSNDENILNETQAAYNKEQRKTKILIELELDNNEMIKMGLKDKVIKMLNK